MRILLTVLFIGILGAYAQEPAYTPMKSNYKFKGIRVDSLFLIPSFADTFAANATKLDSIAGAMIRCGNDFYMRNTSMDGWLQNVNIGAGASPIVNFVNNVFKKSGTDSVYYVIAPADTFFAYKDVGYDTTSLSIRINQKIDSIKRYKDSVYFKVNGSWSFGFKDSLGVGNNFANTDLTATGDRYHDFTGKVLQITDAQSMAFTSSSFGRTNTLDLGDGVAGLYGNNSSGQYWGLNFSPDYNYTYLRNKSNNAYLSRKNFGTDTIAMLSNVNSMNLQKVTDNGNTTTNSFFSKGYTNKGIGIKDTLNIAKVQIGIDDGSGFISCSNADTSNYNVFNIFDNELQFYHTSDDTYSEHFYQFPGNNGTYTISMPFQSGLIALENDYAEPNLNSVDYNITRPPSLLVCNNGNTKKINFPDPDDNNYGRRITIWNYTGGNITIDCPTDIIIDKANLTVTTLLNETVYEFIGIAGKWLEVSN